MTKLFYVNPNGMIEEVSSSILSDGARVSVPLQKSVESGKVWVWNPAIDEDELVDENRLFTSYLAAEGFAAENEPAKAEFPYDPDTQPSDNELLSMADEEYGSDEIEIDQGSACPADKPAVSRGEGGAFVRAWVWVAYPTTEEGDVIEGAE